MEIINEVSEGKSERSESPPGRKSKDFYEEDKQINIKGESEKKLKRLEREYNKIVNQFENNQLFIKSTQDFIKKLETHFKNKKSSQECTSFINTVHNLYTQHIGKLIKKKDNEMDKDTINKYFIYLLYMSWEKGYFQGKMFKNWRENGLKTLEEMNDYCMININLDRLREDISITNIKFPINISENNKNAYLNIFSEVFKILKNNNFAQPDDEITSESRYLSNIQHFINNYANWNKWSLEERDLIKKDKGINKMIFDSLIEMKLIQTKQNIIEFNKFEISTFPASDNKHLLGNERINSKLNFIRFSDYFIEIFKVFSSNLNFIETAEKIQCSQN